MSVSDYATLAELKELVSDSPWGSSYDAVLSKLITRSSRLIDDLVKKWPGYFAAEADTTRYFTGSGGLQQWIDDLAAVPTAIYVSESGTVDNAAGTGGDYDDWTGEAWFLWPDNADALGIPFRRIDLDILRGTKSVWPRLRRAVKITGRFGYSVAPPDDIKQACLIQSMRSFKRAQQAYQDAGAISELGQMVFVKALDPDIQTILQNAYIGVTI